MADASVQAAAAVSVGQTVTVYSLFLPPLTEVRHAASDDPGIRMDVRTGQLGGAVVAAGIGVILANLTGSSVPLFVSVFMAAVIAVVYETAMRKDT